MHAAAVARLIGGAPEGVDRSVELLGEAIAKRPDAASLHNDLAVAYLVRAELRDSGADLVRSLEHFELALLRQPALPEASFNRALLLERLHLLPAAAAAWAAVARLEGGSEWGGEAAARERSARARHEARRRRASTALPPADRGPVPPEARQQVRLHAEEDLLGRWAELAAAGQEREARATLARLRDIGKQLADGGDGGVAEAVRAIDAAEAMGGSRRALLVAGHGSFARGLSAYEGFRFVEAAPLFARAAVDLSAGGSGFAGWAEFYRAVCDYYKPDYPAALRRLGAVAERAPAERFPVLRARVEWMRGLILVIEGRFGESLVHYQNALTLSERAGEAPYVAYLHTLVAENLRLGGAVEEAWQHQLLALRDRDTLSTRERVFTILLDVAEAAEDLGALRASLPFFDAVVEEARSLGQPFLVAEAHLRRARAHDAAGAAAEARADLAAARQAIAGVTEADLAASARADLAAVEGRVLAASSPAEGALRLEEAKRYFERSGDRVGVLTVYGDLARAHLARRDSDAAEAALAAGIEESERQRAALADPQRRAAYFARTQALFDAMIDLQLAVRRAPDTAFSYAERARGRALLDLVAADSSLSAGGSPVAAPRLDLGEVQTALDPGVLLLQYSLLDDRLVVWAIERERREHLVTPVSRERFTELVRRFRDGLDGDGGGAGEELASLLLPPAAWRPGVETLVLVPSRSLYDVPFAALPASAGGRFLAEQTRLVVAPSATLWARRPPCDGSRRPAAGRVLVVADPSFDRARFPRLPDLPGAAAEGRRVADLYAEAELLAGPEATVERVLASLPRAQVVHFAGHAVMGAGPGGSNALLLAPAGDGSGILAAAGIRRAPLARGALVVLGACSTAVGADAATDEVATLASAFLAGGASAVVASLWPVDDRATAALLGELHSRVAAGDDPASALRQAQLRLLRSDDPRLSTPSAWAAFEVFSAAGLGDVRKEESSCL